jgi:uncharacterized protein (DUF924 family)
MNQTLNLSPDDILAFWFEECESKQWFTKDADFDATIKGRFGPVHTAATRCELWDWRSTPRGRLAEIIVLDQFSRNIYRDDPRAFASDPAALVLSQEAVRAGTRKHLSDRQVPFLYMPFMHSESKSIHAIAIELFRGDPACAGNVKFEEKHKAIIDRFGRYPHRNQVLGRNSTPEELEFLKKPGTSF